jgi:hypothetical protein
MSTSNAPFSQSESSSGPGMGKPVAVLALVFILGLLTIGLIYLAGTPASSDGGGGDAQDQASTSPAEQAEPVKPTHAENGKPYVAANGVSPLPKHGEGVAAPITAERLASEEAYEAKPPEDSTLPEPGEPVAWTDAHKYQGQTITVKGTIVDTNNIGQICFLNYDPDWQGKFYVAMFKEAFELLPDPPEEHYLNRTLLVTGKVTLHRDRPQIEVRDVSQIEVVE